MVIPPGVWTGFKGMTESAIVANCATHPHDPSLTERLDPFSDRIPYDWAVQQPLIPLPRARAAPPA